MDVKSIPERITLKGRQKTVKAVPLIRISMEWPLKIGGHIMHE